MPENTSVFFSGMNMDTPAEYMKQGQYIKAQNIRIRSLDGNNFVVETITGSKKQCTIPDIPAYGYRFCLDLSSPFSLTLSYFLFPLVYPLIADQLYPGLGEGAAYTTQQQDNLIAIQSVILTNTNVDEWVARINELYGIQLVQIESRCENSVCLRMIFRTLKSKYVIPNGNIAPSFFGSGTIPDIEELFPVQTLVDIIGYKESSTELILFTTNANTEEETPNSIGSIWRVDISGINDLPAQNYNGNTDLSIGLNCLVYSDRVGFYRSIQLTDVEYIIESECSKFAFWTDNHNPPRILSLGSTGLNITQPALLSFSPNYELGKVIFNGYGSAALPSGVYQYSYRCITADGVPSIWSPLSNHVICFGSTNGDFNEVFADEINVATNKSINLTIDNIDTRFATIQVAAMQFTAENQYPPIKTVIIADQPISGASMQFVHKNMDLVYNDISADSIVISKYIVSRAKNLIIVRDRLVLANICEKNCLDVNISDIWAGEYEFTRSIVIASDSNTGFDYPIMSFKNGVIENRFRGYKRGETYRFGIIFYLLDGSTCFVDKLADIKFPEVYEGYELTDVLTDQIVIRPLGIVFKNIDVTSIKDKITGYSIVRCKRIPKIIAQGITFPYFRNALFEPTPTPLVTWASGFTRDVFTNFLRSDPSMEVYQMLWSPDIDFTRADFNGNLSFKFIGSYEKISSNAYLAKIAEYHTNIYHNLSYTAGQEFPVSQSEFVPSFTEYNQDFFLGIDKNMNQFQLIKCGTSYSLDDQYYQVQQRVYASIFELVDNSVTESRYDNESEYIICSSRSICNDFINDEEVWGGDIFINLYSRILGFTNGTSTTTPQRTTTYVVFPVESTVNTDLRYPDKDQSEPAAKIITEIVPNFSVYPTSDHLEAFNYFNVYSSETPQTLPSKNPALDETECSLCYRTRFVASSPRLIGSKINEFTQILVNEFIDAEYELGDVVHIDTLNDPDVVSQQLFFWQQRGMGIVPMNFKILARDAVQLVTGTGEVFQKAQYISKINGTFHKHSVCKSATTFYWYDQNTRRIMRYGRDGFYPLSGIDSFITQYEGFDKIATIDNPVYGGGIISVYDPNYDEVLFTLLDPRDTQSFDTGSWYNGTTFQENPFQIEQPRFSKTFVYNERPDIKSWTHFMTNIPRMYIRITGNRLLTLQSFVIYPFDVRQFQARLHEAYAGDNECVFGDFGTEPAFIQFYFFVPGTAKITKVIKNVTIDSNKKWDVVLYESNDQHNWNDSNRIAQTWTVPGLPYWQPRNGKWQGDVELVKKVISEDGVQQGLLKRMEGEWFKITFVYPFSDFYDDKLNPGQLIAPVKKRILRSVDLFWDIIQRNR